MAVGIIGISAVSRWCSIGRERGREGSRLNKDFSCPIIYTLGEINLVLLECKPVICPV